MMVFTKFRISSTSQYFGILRSRIRRWGNNRCLFCRLLSFVVRNLICAHHSYWEGLTSWILRGTFLNIDCMHRIWERWIYHCRINVSFLTASRRYCITLWVIFNLNFESLAHTPTSLMIFLLGLPIYFCNFWLRWEPSVARSWMGMNCRSVIYEAWFLDLFAFWTRPSLRRRLLLSIMCLNVIWFSLLLIFDPRCFCIVFLFFLNVIKSRFAFRDLEFFREMSVQHELVFAFL